MNFCLGVTFVESRNFKLFPLLYTFDLSRAYPVCDGSGSHPGSLLEGSGQELGGADENSRFGSGFERGEIRGTL